MKVVLFCGGFGMRMREYSESIPKPMVKIGYRPIIWNIMKYYAHYGHNDFILCLGYKADYIKNYFVNYNEYISNDFVFRPKGKSIELLNSDADDWTITFVDTGLHSNIGERLMKVKEHIGEDEYFLANYTDGLTDLPLDQLIEKGKSSQKTATFMAYKPSYSFHIVNLKEDNLVESISPVSSSGIRINAGYFLLKRDIFDYMQDGDELVEEPFRRLIEQDELHAYPYDGTFLTMDTFKEKQMLDDMYATGNPPWEVWRQSGGVKIKKANGSVTV